MDFLEATRNSSWKCVEYEGDKLYVASTYMTFSFVIILVTLTGFHVFQSTEYLHFKVMYIVLLSRKASLAAQVKFF
jgi:hypothetical protein